MAQRSKVYLTVMLILLSAFFGTIPQHREVKAPDLIIQPADLYTALDVSLAVGDGRKVNFAPFGLGW